MSDVAEEAEKVSTAIAALEAQRASLGDAVVDPAVAALRRQLAQIASNTGGSCDERKLVTILFADISGFTALAERSDAEKVRELINACFDALVPVVQKYGGTIDKFIGDEIMAVFGAPVAHEDDAERALRAALELMDTLVSFNGRQGTTLGLHLGINTGLVVAGEIGGRDRRDYSVMGDAVNLAARLEDASSTGEIYVGAATYRLTSGVFEFESLPPLTLKGKEAAVEVHQLIGLKSTPRSTRGIEGLHSSLVGREAELEKLRDAMALLAGGCGSAFSIIGEAGLGKSRLIAEVRFFAPSHTEWVEARALSYKSGMSYALAREIMLGLLALPAETLPLQTAGVLQRSIELMGRDDLFPYLARMLELHLSSDEEEKVKFLSGEALQARILDAVRSYVRCRAAERPLILVWEDMHWCDPSSRQVHETLLPLVREVPLVVLSASRPEENGGTQPNGDGIRLSPLTREQSGSLIRQLVKIEDLPKRIRELILNRAEGNPFFLEELLRVLIDAGIVVMEGGRAVATRDIDSIQVPETVHGVLAARIDRLQPEEKQALQRASVIGRVFQQAVLAHLYNENTRERLNGALVKLQMREFVLSAGQRGSETSALESHEYIFKHAITHEVAYSSMLLVHRKEFHRRVAEIIERLFPERLAELAATLGFHFDKAETSERAAFYLKRAAESARANFANAEAIASYKGAMRHTESLLKSTDDPSSRENFIQLAEGLGDVLTLTGEQEEACAAFTEALEYCRSEDAIQRSRLYRKIGLSQSLRRHYAQTALAFDKADCELGSEGEPSTQWWEEKLQIQLEKMHLFYWQGMVPEMRVLADKFEDTIASHGTALQRSKFLNLLALSLLMGSRFHPSDECVELGRRAVEASEEVANLSEKGHVRFALGLIQVWHGEYSEAVSNCSAALELSERVGDLVLQARCLNYRALAYRRLGDVTQTRANAERTLALASQLRMVEYMALAKGNLAWVSWKEDELETAECIASEALGLWHAMEEPLSIDWIALWPLIASEGRRGKVEAAIEHMHGFFSEGQHPLDERIMLACRETIDCWKRGEPNAARIKLSHAIQIASELQLL